MRISALFLALLAGCSAADDGAAPAGSFAANARDGLCITAGETQRAGFIVYGEGNANCMARGTLAQVGDDLALVPQGEDAETCRFRIERAGDAMVLAGANGDCSYYCGSGAAIRRTEFRPSTVAAVTDLAGDSLC